MKNRVLVLPLWARIAVVLVVSFFVYGLGCIEDESAWIARSGFPMTCFLRSVRYGTTTVIWHALIVDALFWVALVAGLWIWTGPPASARKKVDGG